MTQLVITGSELQRIKSHLNTNPNSETSRPPTNEDLDKHNKSLARISTWRNTVEANRARHAELKQQEIDAKEASERLLDIEEARVQFIKREEVIMRANEMLLKENDRMKGFSSAMMHSDVLAERANQIELKEQLQRIENLRELKYEELVKHNASRMRDREALENAKSQERRRSLAKMQRKQLEEAKQRRLQEIADAAEEGRVIKSRNERYLEEELQMNERRRQAALRASSETMQAQKYLNEIKAREADRDKEEDMIIERYAIEQEEIASKRKAREELVFNEKQAARQKLIDSQAAKLAEMRDGEEERVSQQCRDAEAEQNRIAAERAARLKEWRSEIELDRRSQMEKKYRQRDEELHKDRKASEFAKLIFEKMHDDEMQEAIERRDAAKRLSRDLLTQIETKAKLKVEEAKSQSNIIKRAQRAINNDVDEFQKYCQNHIREYAENGNNVIPLMNALKNFHKMKNG